MTEEKRSLDDTLKFRDGHSWKSKKQWGALTGRIFIVSIFAKGDVNDYCKKMLSKG